MTIAKTEKNKAPNPWEYMENKLRNFINEEDWPGYKGSWIPPVDIIENDEAIMVKAELPGIKKDDIQLKIHDGILTISGQKKSENNNEKEKIYRNERMYGPFCRSFSLPTTVDAGKIKASYKNGILTVNLPKVEAVKPKEIPIEVG